MAQFRIEVDRGNGWQIRAGGAGATVEQIVAVLPSYCLQYPHRAYVDGVLVAECDAGAKKARKVC